MTALPEKLLSRLVWPADETLGLHCSANMGRQGIATSLAILGQVLPALQHSRHQSHRVALGVESVVWTQRNERFVKVTVSEKARVCTAPRHRAQKKKFIEPSICVFE
jgi:hypothetical protein